MEKTDKNIQLNLLLQIARELIKKCLFKQSKIFV